VKLTDDDEGQFSPVSEKRLASPKKSKGSFSRRMSKSMNTKHTKPSEIRTEMRQMSTSSPSPEIQKLPDDSIEITYDKDASYATPATKDRRGSSAAQPTLNKKGRTPPTTDSMTPSQSGVQNFSAMADGTAQELFSTRAKANRANSLTLSEYTDASSAPLFMEKITTPKSKNHARRSVTNNRHRADTRSEPSIADCSSSSMDSYDASIRKELKLYSKPKKDLGGHDDLDIVQQALKRPFGREYVPKNAKEWKVQVEDFPKWDGWFWKYTISISKKGKIYSTNRSLQDFFRLEQALIQDTGGSLVVPLLEKYCIPADYNDGVSGKRPKNGTPPITVASILNNPKEHVPSEAIENWMNDVVHGVRGEGEVLMTMIVPPDQVVQLEPMQTFWVVTPPGEAVEFRNVKDPPYFLIGSGSQLNGIQHYSPSRKQGGERLTTETLWKSMFSCFEPTSLGLSGKDPAGSKDLSYDTTETSIQLSKSSRISSELFHASSSRAGTPNKNGLVDYDEFDLHLEVSTSNDEDLIERYGEFEELNPELNAYRLYFASYHRFLPRVEKKLHSLIQLESAEGTAWKRFAIAITNLFNCEQELQESKANGNALRKASKFYNKSEIDDGLRLLARNRNERGTLALQALQIMMESLMNDVASVPRSLQAYVRFLQTLRGDDNFYPYKIEKHTASNISSPVSFDSGEKVKSFVAQQTTLLKTKVESVRKQLSPETYKSKNIRSLGDNTDDDSFDESEIAFTKATPECDKMVANEAILQTALRTLCQSTHIRMARIGWKFFKAEIGQAEALQTAAMALSEKLSPPVAQKYFKELRGRHQKEDRADDAVEIKLLEKILQLGNSTEGQQDKFNEEIHKDVMEQANERLGRWNAAFALRIMEAAGAQDAEVRVEETSRELRQVRKHAIDLRAALDRCSETLGALVTTMETSSNSTTSSTPSRIQTARSSFLSAASLMFSGTFVDLGGRDMPSEALLHDAGIDVSDHYGWLTAFESERFRSKEYSADGAKCGKKASEYFKVKEDGITTLLQSIATCLEQYERRVESIESFVFMQCVAIQLEKHFSKVRADSLAEWEKKTDLTQAIAVASKKRLPKLVKELEGKLESLDNNISHTFVKQAKERHLMSKTLKSDIQDLAARRLERLKECAVDQIVELIRLWAQHEDRATTTELRVALEVTKEIEQAIRKADIEADGGASLFMTELQATL